MQIHRGFEHELVLTFAPRGGDDGVLAAAGREAFLKRDRQRGVHADLEPHIHAEVCQRTDCRSELHGLPDSASPMRGVALSAGMPAPGHRAEERDLLLLRREIRQRRLQRLGRRLHQGVVERVIHTHEPGENSLLFQFDRRSPPERIEARKGQRAGTVEGRDRHRCGRAGAMIASASSSARPTASMVPSPRAQSSMNRARSTITARPPPS